MALTAKQIADSLRSVVEELDVPELGGAVRVKPLWGSDPHYLEYLFGGERDPVELAQSINALRLGDNSDGAERRIQVWEQYMERHPGISVEERGVRRVVGTLILCVVDDDDKPLWTWDDVDDVRALINSNIGAALVKVAERAWVLAAPETVDEAGKGSEPTPSS